MTAPAPIGSPALRVRALGKLHAMKRDLGLDDDTYRDFLERETGRRSASALSEGEIGTVIARLGRQATAKPLIPATPQGRLLQGLWMSLHNLAITTDASDAALMAFVKRQTGIQKAEWLRSQQDVEKVAEALKAWLTRDGGVDFRPRKGQPPFMRLATYRVCEAQWNRLVANGNKPEGTLLTFAARVHMTKGIAPEHFTSQHWGHVSRTLGYWVRGEKGRAA